MDTDIEGVFNNTSAKEIQESLLVIDKRAEQLDYFPTFLTPDLGLPSSLHPSIFGQLDTEDQTSGRSTSAGCSDIYSVFAFLAFLFALLDFLLNMMENRKRRSTPAEEECGYSFQHSSDPKSANRMFLKISMGIRSYFELIVRNKRSKGAKESITGVFNEDLYLATSYT